jgi:hypothetical protein
MSGKADFSVDEWDLLRSKWAGRTRAGIKRHGQDHHANGGNSADAVAEDAV